MGFLRHGFRPFFLLGALWAAAAVLLWYAMLRGSLNTEALFHPLAWHRHEMLFGFVPAIMAGFLLTAVPNWTGRSGLAGLPLAALAGLWVAARLAVFLSGPLGVWPALILDAGFLFLLAGWAATAILRAGNRNLPVPVLIALLGCACIADYAGFFGRPELADAGYRAGLAIVITMIALIGGRIVPAFTRNWLVARDAGEPMPAAPGRFDILAVAVAAAFLAAWAAAPRESWVAGGLIAAGCLHAVRVLRWRGWRTAREPLLLFLHLAYLWLPTGLLLLGLVRLTDAVPYTAAVHALTAGAIGAMTLAVMTRASLGHSGRDLRADPATILIFALVTLGALLRVAAPLASETYLSMLGVSALLWSGAFALFVAAYGPLLLGAGSNQ